MKEEINPVVPFASGHSRALLAIAVLLIAALITLIAVGFDYTEIKLLDRIEEGAFVSYEEAEESDNRQAAMGYVQTGIYILMIIPLCVWVHRAYRNLPSLNALNLRFTPGWAVGWWFVPIMNLFRPYQVIEEIWKASDPQGGIRDGNAWKNIHTSALIGWWWALMIMTGLAERVGVYYWRGAEEIDELLTGSYAIMVSDILFISAIIVTVVIIWNIDRRQEQKYRSLSIYKPQFTSLSSP